jgi:hypothetical protein
LAGQEKDQEVGRRNQDHGQTVGANHSATSGDDQNVGRESEFCAAGCASKGNDITDV